MKLKVVMAVVVGSTLLSLSACDGSNLLSVKGKVTVDGVPLKTGSVAFWPDASKGNTSGQEAGGTIAEDGTYELFTKGKPGAAPGFYKVTVAAQEGSDNINPTKNKSLVPEKYTTKEKTTLVIEVVPSPQAGAYDLPMKQ